MITKAAIGAVLVVGAAAALQTYRLHSTQMELITQRVDWQRESARAVQASIDEGTRRTAAVQKEVEDARKKVNDLEGAVAGAADAGGRLRDELARARRLACTTDTTTAGGSAAAEATERVLADVQRRLDEAQERVAQYADRSRIAGLTCQGIHGALTQ
ncbi:DUF2514 family protein [Hydrogenophaga sp.]|uniref:DUF2514 family protein n=1 Tax=Hydrogenophaga sp. TaxID=1904254 RepID=UPI0025C37099|nr:DUF2514 family protein [Hydrogenophaga sp.]MBT9467224.1 DUF2514 family protein [Hydrogenophaga sp.]